VELKDPRPPSVSLLIIISGSTVPVRALVASHRRFRNLFWHLVGLLWASDQPVAKASTYTGQHNRETQRQTSVPVRDSNPESQKPSGQDLRFRTDTAFDSILPSTFESNIEVNFKERWCRGLQWIHLATRY
jgi:hypothetical protein